MKFLYFLLFFSALLSAHALHIFAKQNGDMIELKSYYGGKSMCKNCTVSVIISDQEIKVTTTDESGKASFKTPGRKFKIKVNGGIGHEKTINFISSPQDKDPSAPALPQGDKEASLGQNALKFSFAILLIFAFFGIVYFFKK